MEQTMVNLNGTRLEAWAFRYHALKREDRWIRIGFFDLKDDFGEVSDSTNKIKEYKKLLGFKKAVEKEIGEVNWEEPIAIQGKKFDEMQEHLHFHFQKRNGAAPIKEEVKQEQPRTFVSRILENAKTNTYLLEREIVPLTVEIAITEEEYKEVEHLVSKAMNRTYENIMQTIEQGVPFTFWMKNNELYFEN